MYNMDWESSVPYSYLITKWFTNCINDYSNTILSIYRNLIFFFYSKIYASKTSNTHRQSTAKLHPDGAQSRPAAEGDAYYQNPFLPEHKAKEANNNPRKPKRNPLYQDIAPLDDEDTDEPRYFVELPTVYKSDVDGYEMDEKAV